MLAGPFVAIAMLAQAAGPASANRAPPEPPKPPIQTADRCPTLPANAQPGEIVVVCAQRPEGYRLDPDVLEASRAKRGGGRPKRPERMRDTSCAVVGAAGCIGANPGINLIGAALTAAEIAARLAQGQEIGSLFVTDPQRSDYQLYLEAKHAREAREAEAAAVAKAKAAPGAAAPAAAADPVANSREPGS